MARKKATATSEPKEYITREQATDVLQFAESFYNYYSNGVWNPWSQNRNLLELQGRPEEGDFEAISNALKDSLNKAKELQGYSQFMSVFDTIYAKTLKYYQNILSFDLSYNCVNANSDDYQSQAYKDDKKRIKKFLNHFDYEKDFRSSLGLVIRNGIYYGWFRDSYGTVNDDPIELDDKIKKSQVYCLQTLPQDRCKLTGSWNNGMLFDFDFSYFLNATTDINLYDPCFKTKFKDVYRTPKLNYNPASKLSQRDGTYATWSQLSPQDGMICIKFDDSNFNIVPPFSPLMKIASQDDLIHKYQLDKDAASAWAVLYGSISTFDNAQGGVKPNQYKFTPQSMGNFLNLVQGSLKSIMKTVALPLDDTHFGQFVDQNVNMESTGIENSASQGAYASSMIYSTGKRNQAEVLNGIIADYNLLRPIYKQYEQILNYYANRKTKKYKFKFHFNGSVYPFEREYRRKEITELSDRGFTLNASAWASVYGYAPQAFEDMLEEAKFGDMQDKLLLLANRNTMGGNSPMGNPQGGNPVKDQSDLSDSGAQSRDYK